MSAVVDQFRTLGTTEFRKHVMTLVEVSWEDPAGILQTVPARMEDKSESGALIRLQIPVVVGTKLGVRWRREQFSGHARYCRPDEGEFLAGIQRDSTQSPTPNRPGPTSFPPLGAPPQTIVRSEAILLTAESSTVNVQTPPQRRESIPAEVFTVEHVFKPRVEPNIAYRAEEKPFSVPMLRVANAMPSIPRRVIHDISKADNPSPPPRELHVVLRAESQKEIYPKQLSMQFGEIRKFMRQKWLQLPWRKKPEEVSAPAPKNTAASSDEISASKSDKENPMPRFTQPTSSSEPSVRSAREVAEFQVELSPIEDIYRAAGIMNPRKGYTINKVVEMLHSRHIRDLSKEMKRAALLMALDTAGVPIDQLQKDAKSRQDALDAHEALQRKHLEAEWARKAEEITLIQAELESIKAHYTARISRNMEGVEREKASFADWLTLTHQETQSMAEAVEMCAKSPGSEPTSASSSDEIAKASAKTV
jgi:hypothetical protein